MAGLVEHVHLASTAGAPTSAVVEAEAVAGVGLRGDRYADGAGYWRDDRVSRDLTLVEAEVVDELAGFAPGELRRNVTTRGVSLDDLVGSTFWVGEALCRGTELCEPCRHLEELTGRPLLRALVHRGGVRARILSGGIVRVGDPVEAAEELDGVGALVERDGRLLLGRRLAPHGYGTWSCPGGKPEAGETPLACAERELYEETGLEARATQVVAETVRRLRRLAHGLSDALRVDGRRHRRAMPARARQGRRLGLVSVGIAARAAVRTGCVAAGRAPTSLKKPAARPEAPVPRRLLGTRPQRPWYRHRPRCPVAGAAA